MQEIANVRMASGESLAWWEDAEALGREGRCLGVEMVESVGVGEDDAEVERFSRRRMIGCGLR